MSISHPYPAICACVERQSQKEIKEPSPEKLKLGIAATPSFIL
jgi:hypothetical protein